MTLSRRELSFPDLQPHRELLRELRCRRAYRHPYVLPEAAARCTRPRTLHRCSYLTQSPRPQSTVDRLRKIRLRSLMRSQGRGKWTGDAVLRPAVLPTSSRPSEDPGSTASRIHVSPRHRKVVLLVRPILAVCRFGLKGPPVLERWTDLGRPRGRARPEGETWDRGSSALVLIPAADAHSKI